MKSHFEILKQILDEKIIAIVRLDNAEHLVKVAEALKAGGISAIEFTMSTPGALEMVKEASAATPWCPRDSSHDSSSAPTT